MPNIPLTLTRGYGRALRESGIADATSSARIDELNRVYRAYDGTGVRGEMPPWEEENARHMEEEVREARDTVEVRRSMADPREPQVVRDLSRDTLRFQCEGDSTLLAEVERCYNILKLLPAPQDRTEQDIENLIIALTEEVATVTENQSPAGLATRHRGYGASLPF